MKKTTFSASNFELWLLLGKVSHAINLVRQIELNRYNVPVRQAHVLRVVQALGPKATLSEVAKQVERKLPVISVQAVTMEKNGLIKRIKTKPNVLRLELTRKGLEIANASKSSKSIDQIFSFLHDEDRQQMESILKRVLINLKK